MNLDLLNISSELKENLEDKRVQIFFDPKFREFFIWGNDQKTVIQTIKYCPFTGEELVSSLRNQWFDILEDEFNIDDPTGEDRNKVPSDFLDETWWVKRKL
tara:strand:- start:244323 stop:244625 length:303 start_codon:yes stop_codon:yes gene_type:complete